MTLELQPTCRYGHGNLIMIDEHGDHPKWGFISQSDAQVVFSGNLYVCKICGYLELFDDQVELTITRQANS